MAGSFILFGLDRAGTTMHASLLTKELRIPHLSPCRLFQWDSLTGIEQDQQMELPADLSNSPHAFVLRVLRMRLRLSDTRQGWIFTGYPTSATQAQYFDALLNSLDRPKPQAICLNVDQQLLLERLQELPPSKLNISPKERLLWESLRVSSLRQYYQAQDRLITIDGNASLKIVHERLLKAIQSPVLRRYA